MTHDELSDIQEITDVVHSYIHANDGDDLEGMLAGFTDDVRLQFGNTLTGEPIVLHGIDAARAMFSTMRQAETLPIDEIVDIMHMVSNVRVTLDGDRAHCDSTAASYTLGPRGGEKIMLIRGYTYSDDLVRGPKGWKIAARVHALKFQFEATPTVGG